MQYETETNFRFYLSNNYTNRHFIHILTVEVNFYVITSGRIWSIIVTS